MVTGRTPHWKETSGEASRIRRFYSIRNPLIRQLSQATGVQILIDLEWPGPQGEDETLHRFVALKFLSDYVANDA
jgi:hypothetical protein